MLRGLYSAASGMMANQRRSEALTNNLANSQSPGYKTDDAVFRSFPEYLLSAVHGTKSPIPPNAPLMGMQKHPIGKLAQGVYTQELIPNFRQGDLQETQNSFDVALVDDHLQPVEVNGTMIQPRHFLAVERNGEKSYTRNGSFTLDSLNQLVTADGHLVLDTEGNSIVLTSDQYRIDDQGYLWDENGQAYTGLRNPGQPDEEIYSVRLQVVQLDNPYDLIKTENGAFRWQGQGEPAIAEAPLVRLRQGFIERSNVNVQQTMVELMQTSRSLESNQRVLSAYNQTLDRLFESSRLT
ncbi:flagellar hook-basal body protein [Ammoniphilus sp. CFH 90114]|uniref:flagellar hook-basal body protein n=1 Tax=Ammoniphilus sp. CFH 90114 TaxID=2493665 RepID=UPI00100F1ACC|nr:flagellar hook-basal body protein [Ammoniphilus sp. CFH 90114]RXT04360.1 flagellar hook-basal body protein [Ammoniphilus sp. CFH 90114]